jgi:capsular exopolysaccharide synthesis family protein
MSRVYEALKKAEQERKQKITQTEVSTAKSVYEEKKKDKKKIVKEKVKRDEGLQIAEKIAEDQAHNLLVTLQDPLSYAADQFKKVCIRIVQNGQDSNKRILMIMSPLPQDGKTMIASTQDGKTMIASNLAISLASLPDTHVTLIDADLRKPGVHKMLGVSVNKGLAEYLEQKANISEIYYDTPIPRLFIIPGNEAYAHPEKILSSKKVQRLLKKLQTKHPEGYIVIDSSPMLLSIEPEILLNSVDSVIMVVRYGNTQRDSLQKAMGLLDKKKITGIIFNQVQQGILSDWFNGTVNKYYKYYHPRKE